SSLTQEEKQAVRAEATGGRLKLLYVAPETLNTEAFQGFLGRLQVSLLAVDEAHCVSQWGHDFRPDYLEVARLRERLPSVPLVALTATADPLTRKEVLGRLGLSSAQVFASSFDRPNIKYEIALKDSGREQLLSFLREEGLVICATIAFGMGIDKPDVRFVAHLDLPKSVEGYYQETGRAGRDGLPASAFLLYGLGEMVQLRQLIQQGEGGEEFKRLQQQKLTQMLGLCEGVACRRQMVLAYFGESHPGACGNCDNCLEGVKTHDGTVVAQKALSAVARTGGRFGAGHLIDVLLARETEKTERNQHQGLSVWGIGKDLDERKWSSVYRQLVAGGFLDVDAEAYGALTLNEKSWQVLRKQQEVRLREDPPPSTRSRSRNGSGKPAAPALSGEEAQAFEALRSLRKRVADEQGLTPFVMRK
ncbi:MAG: ATP-dependent DNA helicase RecQ, partial [Deltaproteobacteria bacterium]